MRVSAAQFTAAQFRRSAQFGTAQFITVKSASFGSVLRVAPGVVQQPNGMRAAS
ncbi:hypothetical protein [Microbispora hainanensis]|uniref:hypothetical protein n=1 Tax=Microbispora hainanensis TaxID=568844 RepID=UPI0032476593